MSPQEVRAHVLATFFVVIGALVFYGVAGSLSDALCAADWVPQ